MVASYAQIVDNASHLVLGNQTTPIPVTLDGAAHTLTIPLEAVAADVTAGKSYTLQLTDGSDLVLRCPSAGPGRLLLGQAQHPHRRGQRDGQPDGAAAAGRRVPGRRPGASTGARWDRSRWAMTRAAARRALRFSATRGRSTWTSSA